MGEALPPTYLVPSSTLFGGSACAAQRRPPTHPLIRPNHPPGPLLQHVQAVHKGLRGEALGDLEHLPNHVTQQLQAGRQAGGRAGRRADGG